MIICIDLTRLLDDDIIHLYHVITYETIPDTHAITKPATKISFKSHITVQLFAMHSSISITIVTVEARGITIPFLPVPHGTIPATFMIPSVFNQISCLNLFATGQLVRSDLQFLSSWILSQCATHSPGDDINHPYHVITIVSFVIQSLIDPVALSCFI